MNNIKEMFESIILLFLTYITYFSQMNTLTSKA